MTRTLSAVSGLVGWVCATRRSFKLEGNNMPMRPLMPLFLMLIFLASCGREAATQVQKFQLVTASDGTTYRLNTMTGDVFLVSGRELFAVNEGYPVVRVDEFYEMGDAKDQQNNMMKYVGDGVCQKVSMREVADKIVEKYKTAPRQ
jgi:hypothetical protein